MAIIKEDKEKMNQFYKNLAFYVNNALPEHWYHVIIGSFYYMVDDNLMDSYQIYYQMKRGDDYLNLLEEFWNGVDDGREDALDEVSLLLSDMHDYCKDCGDDYTEMTFDFKVNGEYSVDYSYDEIAFDSTYLDLWQANHFEY
ncbi:MAG: DUF600 family protein [Erysipelotrichaceae bacterium]|nr:DUF600 family protein [Erysipelotrichaceae bacterium]